MNDEFNLNRSMVGSFGSMMNAFFEEEKKREEEKKEEEKEKKKETDTENKEDEKPEIAKDHRTGFNF